MQEAVAAVANILDVELVAVLELVARGGIFVLRAAAGWPGDDRRFTSRPVRAPRPATPCSTRGPVVVADWETEQRFETRS